MNIPINMGMDMVTVMGMGMGIIQIPIILKMIQKKKGVYLKKLNLFLKVENKNYQN